MPMTGEDMRTSSHDRRDDAAAYVLGALDASELDEFRAHLESCVACRDEVNALQLTVDVLPLAALQVAAPKSLRRRVLRAASAEQASAQAADPPRRRPASLRTWFGGRPGLALAGAAATVLIAFGAVEISGSGGTGTRVIQASVIGSTGQARLTVSGGQAQLVVHHIASPPAGEIYEVWLERAGGRLMPTKALFGVTSAGDGDVGVPGSLSGVQQVLVTREPAGGSTRPTHSPVIVARLT
jgi:anti-sigma-K factor RskA